MPNYPGALPALTTTRVTGNVIPASDHNDTAGEVNAIGAELGTNPKGAAATVRARLDSLEANVAVNAKKYGVVGDGIVDDTSALQAWLTACAGTHGYLPPGNYLARSTLTVPANATIEGAGWATKITQDGAWTTSTVGVLAIRNVAGVTIRDLHIEGQRSTKGAVNPNAAVAIAGCQNVTVERVYVTDPTYCGIIIAGVSGGAITRDITVRACYVYRGGNDTTGQLANGISTDGTDGPCRNISILGNHLNEITDCAIGIHDDSESIVVAGNVIANPGACGIDVPGGKFVTISANTVRFPGLTAPANAAGIRLVFDKSTYSPQDCVVTGNILQGTSTGNGTIGILVLGLETTALIRELVIGGNIIKGFTTSTSYGLYVSLVATIVKIHDNMIIGSTLAGLVIDEVAGSLVSHCAIQNNMIAGNLGYGIQFLGAVPNGKVQGNYLTDNSSGGSNATVAQKEGLAWLGNGPQDLDSYLPGLMSHRGASLGFYSTTPIAKPTGVAVTAAGIHAALVNLGLIAA